MSAIPSTITTAAQAVNVLSAYAEWFAGLSDKSGLLRPAKPLRQNDDPVYRRLSSHPGAGPIFATMQTDDPRLGVNGGNEEVDPVEPALIFRRVINPDRPLHVVWLPPKPLARVDPVAVYEYALDRQRSEAAFGMPLRPFHPQGSPAETYGLALDVERLRAGSERVLEVAKTVSSLGQHREMGRWFFREGMELRKVAGQIEETYLPTSSAPWLGAWRAASSRPTKPTRPAIRPAALR